MLNAGQDKRISIYQTYDSGLRLVLYVLKKPFFSCKLKELYTLLNLI